MNKIRETILSELPDANLLEDDFDSALMGIAVDTATLEACPVYSFEALMELIANRDHGGCMDDAAEWFDYNIAGAYLGGPNPVFVRGDL